MYIETIEFGFEMQGGGLLIEEEQGVWSKLKTPKYATFNYKRRN